MNMERREEILMKKIESALIKLALEEKVWGGR